MFSGIIEENSGMKWVNLITAIIDRFARFISSTKKDPLVLMMKSNKVYQVR